MHNISSLFSRLWSSFVNLLFPRQEIKVEIKTKSKTCYKPCATKRKLTKRK
jgi:hypothetical protein